MFVVERRIYIHSLATNFIVFALASTFAAVKLIFLHINTFFVAAVRHELPLGRQTLGYLSQVMAPCGALSARKRPVPPRILNAASSSVFGNPSSSSLELFSSSVVVACGYRTVMAKAVVSDNISMTKDFIILLITT